MRKIVFSILFVLTSYTFLAAQTSINFMTYNIRMNTSSDGVHAWPNRKDDVTNLIRFHQADIFSLQEVLDDQMQDLVRAFPDYGYVGIGRDNGKRKGEYAPIFFRKEVYSEVQRGYFWLSETPEEPSLGWDAACIRICSWIQLEERASGTIFYVFNTHFDHVGTVARSNAADLILLKMKEFACGNPAILCGDLNMSPASAPIKKLSTELKDSFLVTALPAHGSVQTYRGFNFDDTPGDRIDYVFVSDALKVLRYGALTDSRDRSFFSDHLPVLVELEF